MSIFLRAMDPGARESPVCGALERGVDQGRGDAPCQPGRDGILPLLGFSIPFTDRKGSHWCFSPVQLGPFECKAGDLAPPASGFNKSPHSTAKLPGFFFELLAGFSHCCLMELRANPVTTQKGPPDMCKGHVEREA